MESKRLINRSWLGKTITCLFFGLFVTATAKAQILGLGAPKIDVSPVGTNVQNGDTVTLTVTAECSVGNICTVNWLFKNGSLPTNATVTVNGQSANNFTPANYITSTLTLTHVSPACAGNYSVDIEDELLGGILGLTTAWAYSPNAAVGIIPTVTAVPSGSWMTQKGYKIQFSGPTGSNLVIQASSDMKNWTSVYTNVMTAGSLTYTDVVAKTVSTRFYRAKLK